MVHTFAHPQLCARRVTLVAPESRGPAFSNWMQLVAHPLAIPAPTREHHG
jgi:hypothetical protein